MLVEFAKGTHIMFSFAFARDILLLPALVQDFYRLFACFLLVMVKNEGNDEYHCRAN